MWWDGERVGGKEQAKRRKGVISGHIGKDTAHWVLTKGARSDCELL